MATPPTVEEIRSEMRSVRNALAVDVSQLKEDTQALTDWKQYVRTQPLLAFAAASLVGYLLIPKKKQVTQIDAKELARLIKREKLVIAPESRSREKSGLLAGVLGLVGSLAVKSAANLASQHLGAMVANKNSPTNHWSAETNEESNR